MNQNDSNAQWLDGLAAAARAAILTWLTTHAPANVKRAELAAFRSSAVATLLQIAVDLAQTIARDTGVALSEREFTKLVRQAFREARKG